MINKIILVRHGESEPNKDNPKRKLTKKGKLQIQEATRMISPLVKNENICIVTTNTVRTKSSAKILSSKLSVSIYVRDNLRTENIKMLKALTPKTTSLTSLYFEYARQNILPKKIPSPKEMADRFLDIVNNNRNDEIIIFVGHSSTLESFIFYQNEFKSGKFDKFNEKELDYGQVVVLDRVR